MRLFADLLTDSFEVMHDVGMHGLAEALNLFFHHRGGCHNGRARDRNDQDAQGPLALVQQLAARAHPSAGIDSRGHRRRFVGVWLGQTYGARARRVRGGP